MATVSQDQRFYKVTRAFRRVGQQRLPFELEFAPGIRIQQDGDDYVAEMDLEARSAEEALGQARAVLDDLLGLLALTGGAYIIVDAS